ncbi:hypothetical protein Vau01_104740 [Virgisporangium aurantiacum]|uniref:Right handed beta helix domain-containing protein n=1 Tax=Virgisporangium aurantiacum TaxID=175570 RepID=A0A8J3ZHK9_9ACTN|nr:hypothetical protein Vau01_104740 [Virgisporangium aurantiacum]
MIRIKWGEALKRRQLVVAVALAVGTLTVPTGQPAPAAAAAERTPGGWYAQLPTELRVCDGDGWNGGPSVAPDGSVVVPAGDNTGFNFGQTGQTYWFAPGVHTLGTGEYSTVTPGSGSSYLGAPGAVLDGMNANKYAFAGPATDVRIAYLEIRNFGRGLDNNNEGVINHNASNDWLMEFLYAHHNDGAAVFLGSLNTIRDSCLKDNGQYGVSMYDDQVEGDSAIKGIVVDNNEIVGNNQDDWETREPGCGCTGGVKFWDVKGATVTANYVHDNLSVGLWADTNNIDFLFDSNWIEHNQSVGIWYEISYNATMSRNVFKRNGWVSGNQNLGSPSPAIYISESGGDARLQHSITGSPNLDIRNNLFEDNFSGVSIYENANRFCNANGNTSKTYCTPFVSPTVIPPPYDFDYLDPINATHPCYTSIANEPYRSDCRWHSRDVKVFSNEFRFDQAKVPCAGTYCGAQALIATGADNLPWMPYTVSGIQQDVMFNNGNSFHDNAYFGDWRFARGWGDTISWNTWRAAPYNQDAGSTLDGASGPPPIANALDVDTATLEGSLGKWSPWFGCTLERVADAAHSGGYGLRVALTGASFGVSLANWPGFTANPGGKRVSLWARQGTSPGVTTATLSVRWFNADQVLLATDVVPITGLTPNWQEFTAQLTAPSTAATVFLELTGGGGATGNTLLLDDLVVADQQ